MNNKNITYFLIPYLCAFQRHKSINTGDPSIQQQCSCLGGGIIIRFLHSLLQQAAFSSTATKLDSEAGINILPSGL